MPLNRFLADAVWPMSMKLPMFAAFEYLIARHARLRTPLAGRQRFAAYKRTPQAFAVVAGGSRLDHNLLPKRGVIPPDGVPR